MHNLIFTVSLASKFNGCSALTKTIDGRFIILCGTDVFSIILNPKAHDFEDKKLSIDILKVYSENEDFVENEKLLSLENYLYLDWKNNENDNLEEINLQPSIDIKNPLTNRGIKYIKCQHCNTNPFQESLIIMLRFDYILTIYYEKYLHKWTKIKSFLNLIEELKASSLKFSIYQFTGSNDHNKSYEDLKLKQSDEWVTCAVWSSLFPEEFTNKNESLFLFANGTYNRNLFVWTVEIKNNCPSFHLAFCIKLFKINLEEIFFMPIFSNSSEVHLIATCKTGRIYVLKFSYRFDLQKQNKFELKYEKPEILWDELDNMKCTNIKYFQKKGILVILKNQYLLLWNVKKEDGKLTFIHLKNHFINCRFYISNILEYEENFLMTLFDGELQKIASLKDNELCIEEIPLAWKTTSWRNFGFNISNFDSFIMMVNYPSKNYSTKSYRRPSLVHFLSCKTFDEVTERILSYEGHIPLIHDLLCFFKYEIINGKQLACEFYDSIHDETKWIEYSLNKLKIIRLIMCYESLYYKKVSKEDEMEKYQKTINEIEIIIMSNYFMKCLNNFISNFNYSDLNDKEKESLDKMMEFVKIHKTYANKFNNYDKILDIHEKLDSFKQKCILCDMDIPLNNFKSGACQYGHYFVRCSHSLLMCFEMTYRSCHTCSTLSSYKKDLPGRYFEHFMIDNCNLCDSFLMDELIN